MAATLTYITKNEPMEARFVLAGETFERKSVEYRVLGSATTTGGTTTFLARALYPDGTRETTLVELPARLVLTLTGRWVP